MKKFIPFLILIFSFPISSDYTEYTKFRGKKESPLYSNFIRDHLKGPIYFEVNRGQSDKQFEFISRGNGYSLLLASDRTVLNLHTSYSTNNIEIDKNNFEVDEYSSQIPDPSSIQMQLIGACSKSKVVGSDLLPGKSNYYIGNNPDNWHTNIVHYKKVKYQEIYPGIDLDFYGNQNGQLEYDFIVKPGADPEQIKIRFEGINSSHIDDIGNLCLSLNDKEVLFEKPIIYQEINNSKKQISGRYQIDKSGLIKFRIENYNPQFALVIDPVLVYATYLGGSLMERVGAITLDKDKNVYVTGITASTDFPKTNPEKGIAQNWSILVLKISSDGKTLEYSTVMGGSRVDSGIDIEVDDEGNAYICGESRSYDDSNTSDVDESFPIVDGFQTSLAGNYGSDVVVAKIGKTGDLLYSSYLGANNDQDEAKAIAVDKSGNMYVTGVHHPSMDTPGFPIRNAFQPNAGGYDFDGFVTKVNPNLKGDASLIYSTFLGGLNEDEPEDIAVDNEGNAIIVGRTEAADFPLVNPLFFSKKGDWDAFITKLDQFGSAAVYSTYIGGDKDDDARIVKIDPNGFAYIAGSGSEGFPTTLGAYDEKGIAGYGGSIIFKLNPAGTNLEYSTFVNPYSILSLTIDKDKNLFFPGNYGKFIDGKTVWIYVINKLNETGSNILSSDEITGLDFVNMGYYSSYVVDESGNIYFAYSPTRADLPTHNPIQAEPNGNEDLYIGWTGKNYLKFTRICPDPTDSLWLPYTLHPGEEWQFIVYLQYALSASNRGTIDIKVEDNKGNELTSHKIQNVPRADDLYYNNIKLNKIIVPNVEESDSLFVKAYLTPDGWIAPIDSAIIAYKIVVHKWTFLVYINGDNNIEGEAINDWYEMTTVGSNDSLAIVVCMDRHPKYDKSNNDWSETRYMALRGNKKPKYKSMGELDMGHPRTLYNFIQWGRNNFPAEHYALNMWDHGNGWMAPALEKQNTTFHFPTLPPGLIDDFDTYLGFGPDETNNNYLFSPEIKIVFDKVTKFDLFWFTTCLNGMIENVYEFRNGADYFVASEDKMPGTSWNYKSFFSHIKEYPDMTGEEIAKYLVNSYGPEYSQNRKNITISAIKMSEVNKVVQEVDYLAEMLIEKQPWEDIDAVLTDIHQFDPFPYRDLYHFALLLRKKTSDSEIQLQCDHVMGTLNNCIALNYASIPEQNSYGLSIYFPTALGAFNYGYIKPYYEFSDRTKWDEFLLLYLSRKNLPPGVEGPVLDTYEVNDNITQAYGPLLPEELYLSYIPYAGDHDFYFFTTDLQTDLLAKLTSPIGINYDLKLMDINKQTIDSSILDQEVDSIYIASLQPGLYYLEIVTNNNFFEQPYILELNYQGSEMGQIPLSFDDGAPDAGLFSENAGEVLGSNFHAPVYPMKLDEVSFFINSFDGAGTGGDGSFYVWLADFYGTKIDPFKVTPSEYQILNSARSGGWFAVNLADKDITLQSDFFIGIGYDGENTPVLGTDPFDDGRTFQYDSLTQTWQALPMTAFIRAKASYFETPHQVAFILPDVTYALPGELIYVPLELSNIAETVIDSLEIDISYDPSVIQLDFISFENTLKSDWIISKLDTLLSGYMSLTVHEGTPVTNNETLLNMSFRIQSNAVLGDSCEIVLERILANGGQVFTSSRNAKVFVGNANDIDDGFSERPKIFALYQNYPNPFNPNTTIKYSIAKTTFVTLKVYNLLGCELATLVNEKQSEGNYKVRWDSTNQPSGVYFYRIIAGDPSASSGQEYVATKKMILLR